MAFRPCESGGCYTVHLSPTDRKRLRAIVDDRNSAQKHVWRTEIVLATADGLGTVETMPGCEPSDCRNPNAAWG